MQSLSKYEALGPIERLELLLASSTPTNIIANCSHNRASQLLKRDPQLLRQWMVRVSQNDLSLTTEIVQHCSRSPETLEAFNDHAALVRQCSNHISNPISLADILPRSDPDRSLICVAACQPEFVPTSNCVLFR